MFRLRRLFETLGPIYIHNALQIIDIVKIYIVNSVDLRIDISGHSDVYEKQRPILPGPHPLFHLCTAQNGIWRPRRTNDYVYPSQLLGQILPGHRSAVEPSGQSQSPFQGAIRHHDSLNPVGEKMFSSQFSHLSSPDQQSDSSSQLLKYLFGQLHSCIADGNSTATDAGLCSYPLGHGKGFVQKPVENYPGCFNFRSLTVCILNLAEYLRFAHHH